MRIERVMPILQRSPHSRDETWGRGSPDVIAVLQRSPYARDETASISATSLSAITFNVARMRGMRRDARANGWFCGILQRSPHARDETAAPSTEA